MKCKRCHKLIPDKSKFCCYCGKPTSEKKLYRRKDGLYEKILNLDGKRVAFRGKTEKEVYQKIAAYEEKQSFDAEHGELFTEVADRWRDEHEETVSPTSWNQGYSYPYKEIMEYFDGVYIKDITHKDINRYMKQLPKSYARKTCAQRLAILNMIFKFAVVEDILTDNPCSYITVPKGHGANKRRAPTGDEISEIRGNISLTYKNFSVGFLAVFLLYTGCRKGEALALTFGDVDRKKKRLSISKSVYYVSNDPHLKQPKTAAGVREIIIPDFLFDIMPNGKSDDLIFCRNSGELMKKDFFDKAWRYWRDETGIDLTAHQLRHGYATLLHEMDINVKDAQELLGHADASTTQNIYTEVSNRRKSAVADKINSYLQ